MSYTYHVSVKENTPTRENNTVQFDMTSHDDVFGIVEKLGTLDVLDENTRSAFVFGLKSLGYALLSHRDSPMVAKLMPHFSSLMKEMKSEIARL